MNNYITTFAATTAIRRKYPCWSSVIHSCDLNFKIVPIIIIIIGEGASGGALGIVEALRRVPDILRTDANMRALEAYILAQRKGVPLEGR